MNDAWLKRILMIPARVKVAKSAALQRVRHALRRRPGNASKRPQCCGPRPSSYPVNQKVSSIADLSQVLERTSTINGGYSPFFCCRICGQEWYEDWEQLKFGGNTCVRKAA
jgi:hypothetical protein